MLLKIAILTLIATSLATADKLETSAAKSPIADIKKSVEKVLDDLKTSESQKVIIKEVLPKKQVADERSDTVSEKSDIYEAPSSTYESGTPVSQGNLYYYYYPVAAYPVHASDKISSGSSSASAGSSGNSLLESPLVFILVPLILLLLAAPLVALFANSGSTSRSFGSYRQSNLDEKFGSFAELQEAIDYQLAKYMTVLDSENCMDRIVCELGVKASNIPHKNLFYR